MTTYQTGGFMSEQQNPGTDQTTGEGPVDPSTPSRSSQVPADQQERSQQAQQGEDAPAVKSPDQESEESREGGGYGNPNSQETPQEEYEVENTAEQDQS